MAFSLYLPDNLLVMIVFFKSSKRLGKVQRYSTTVVKLLTIFCQWRFFVFPLATEGRLLRLGTPMVRDFDTIFFNCAEEIMHHTSLIFTVLHSKNPETNFLRRIRLTFGPKRKFKRTLPWDVPGGLP